MNKRNALLVVLLLLIVGPIVVGLGRTAITLSDEQNRQILNGREVPPDQPIAPITEPVSVVQCADGRTLTMNRSWFRYSDDQYPQRWAAPHMGSGGDRQAEERDRCLGGDN